MRNSCVQLKTKLGEIRSFLPQPPKFPGWGWGEGPTFRLSSHPLHLQPGYPCALLTPLGVEVGWDCPALSLWVGSWAWWVWGGCMQGSGEPGQCPEAVSRADAEESQPGNLDTLCCLWLLHGL